MKSSQIKISFTGDIMCKSAQTEACRHGDSYNYAKVFKLIKNELQSCDYLVGNLETVIAGEELGYTNEMYSFNTPLPFAEELVRSGFNLVSTANNHCLDRGTQGLLNNIESLDSIKLPHIGTYSSREERDMSFIADIKGIRVGFLAYTYGTNAFANHRFLKPEQKYMVNLFQPQEKLLGSIHLLQSMEKIGKEVNELYKKDNVIYKENIQPYLEQLKGDIDRCRRDGADYVIMCMHSGGQYNPEPDPYTVYLVQWLCDAGVDAIIGNHPHVVHKFEMKNNTPVAYCLGNFITTLGVNPNETGTLTEYSILLNLYLSKCDTGTKVEKIGFSVLKTVMQPDQSSVVIPVYDLLDHCKEPCERDKLIRENRIIAEKFSGIKSSDIMPQKEYFLSV